MAHRKIIEEVFSTLELTPNCKRCYLHLFEQGACSVGQIAEALVLDRSSTYLAIHQLQVEGFVEVDSSKRPKQIQAIHPRKILARLERKIQKLEEVFDITHDSMPKLEAAYTSGGNMPVLRAFSGKDGLYQIVDDVLQSGDKQILLFTNQSAERQVFNKHDHDFFIRKRKQRGLKINVLAANDEFARLLKAGDKASLRHTKLITGSVPFKCETYIYDDKVAMLGYGNQIIGFIVQSKDFSQLIKWQFEKLWSMYK
jgi:sugar-specific transcriptional regulator TrmB